MRVVAFIIICLALIIGVGFYTTALINTTAEELSHYIDRLEKNIVQENWEESTKDIGELSKAWSKTKENWLLFLDHQEIDNIDLTYTRLNKYVETKELPSALAEVAALKLLVQHIPNISALNLRNIF
jgi:predicted PurR-regulated permease PerM